jgi:hypothetical protein
MVESVLFVWCTIKKCPETTTFPFIESPRHALSIRLVPQWCTARVRSLGRRRSPRVSNIKERVVPRLFVRCVNASELRIEVRSGKGIEPCGGAWSSLMQLVAEIILTQRTRPKSIDVLHADGKLIFKTNTRAKLYGREGATIQNNSCPVSAWK